MMDKCNYWTVVIILMSATQAISDLNWQRIPFSKDHFTNKKIILTIVPLNTIDDYNLLLTT